MPSTLLNLWTLLAQATPKPTPTPNPSVDVELLKSQIDFLKTANSSLAEGFSRYVTTMNISLSIVAFVLTAITLFGAVLFGKSLKDFYDTLKNIRRDVDGIVRQQVEQEIGVVIRNRVDRLETILAREAILGRVTVDYVIPTDQLQILPPELKFLQTRGFQTTPKIIAPTQLASLPLPADVIVLDLFNAGITTEAQAEPIITTLISKLPYKQAVLVVYIVGFHSQTLNTVIANGHLCIPAQSPLSLVGRVIDAAYVADAL